MAQDSKRKRRERRLRRERNIYKRIALYVMEERDQARVIALTLENELQKREGEAKPKGGFVIEKLEDDGAEENIDEAQGAVNG